MKTNSYRWIPRERSRKRAWQSGIMSPCPAVNPFTGERDAIKRKGRVITAEARNVTLLRWGLRPWIEEKTEQGRKMRAKGKKYRIDPGFCTPLNHPAHEFPLPQTQLSVPPGTLPGHPDINSITPLYNQLIRCPSTGSWEMKGTQLYTYTASPARIKLTRQSHQKFPFCFPSHLPVFRMCFATSDRRYIVGLRLSWSNKLTGISRKASGNHSP